MNRILFVFSAPPHGSIKAQEGFDALLMGSAFAECGVLFLGEAVLQLVNNQQPEVAGFKHFALGFSALADYGVAKVTCQASALKDYHLAPTDLVIDVEVLDDADIRQLLLDYDKVLNF